MAECRGRFRAYRASFTYAEGVKQFDLFEAQKGAHEPSGRDAGTAGTRPNTSGESDSKTELLKEKKVLQRARSNRATRTQYGCLDQVEERSGWPAALSVKDASDYSSLSRTHLEHAARRGHLNFKRVGPHGSRAVLRAQLDAYLATIFERPADSIETDFDFG